MMTGCHCHEVQHGSREWLVLRSGNVTASEVSKVFTPKTRKPSTQADSYLSRLVAERITGEPVEMATTGFMERGLEIETEAKNFYLFDTDAHEMLGPNGGQIGFVSKEGVAAGCSPDALLLSPSKTGVEIKCPAVHTHTEYLLTNKVPEKYWAQIQFSLWVTGGTFWDFISYCPGFPPLIRTVQRDEKWISSMELVVLPFLQRVANGANLVQSMAAGTQYSEKVPF